MVGTVTMAVLLAANFAHGAMQEYVGKNCDTSSKAMLSNKKEVETRNSLG